ncbi:MAG: preprotein translocase subunit YajC [Clostridia bacterium]|nr:preprotein translocase subunit YajC [Clostridia bacterium]
MNKLFLLLEEQSAPQQQGSWLPIILMVGVIIVMYFIMIRPQKKQQKQIEDMRNNLQIGDEITTIGGIIGKIVSIKEETCIIETGRDGVRMRILRSAVRCVDVPASAMNYSINVEDKSSDEDFYDDNAAAENKETEGKKKNKKK